MIPCWHHLYYNTNTDLALGASTKLLDVGLG